MGAASALALARNGAKVAIAGRRLENLESTALKSEDTNKILFKEADVTDRTSLNELFDWYDQKIGELDILIHAAGINVALRSMEELTPEE